MLNLMVCREPVIFYSVQSLKFIDTSHQNKSSNCLTLSDIEMNERSETKIHIIRAFVAHLITCWTVFFLGCCCLRHSFVSTKLSVVRFLLSYVCRLLSVLCLARIRLSTRLPSNNKRFRWTNECGVSFDISDCVLISTNCCSSKCLIPCSLLCSTTEDSLCQQKHWTALLPTFRQLYKNLCF